MSGDDQSVPSATGAPSEAVMVDLLDRLLSGGVAVSGDVTLAIGDVDLVRVSLDGLVNSVSAIVDTRP